MDSWKTSLAASGAAIVIGLSVVPALEWGLAAPPPAVPGSLGAAMEAACDPARPSAAMDAQTILACRDIGAQESMASSTRRLWLLTIFQLIVGALGAAGVVYSLLLSRKSLDLTREALEHQQHSVRTQLRARMGSVPTIVTVNTDQSLTLELGFKNVGETNARRVCRTVRWRIVDGVDDRCQLNDVEAPWTKGTVKVPTSLSRFAIHLAAALNADFAARRKSVQILIFMTYEDEFGGLRKASFNEVRFGPQLRRSKRMTGVNFDDPHFEGRTF